jgi:membrane-associated phospholipid phosphatase
MITLNSQDDLVRSRMRNLSLNATDRITILYSVIVAVITFVFRAKISAYGYHLAFNLSAIILVLLLSLGRASSLGKTGIGLRGPFMPAFLRTLSLWYPLILYGFFYYQTGLINTVVVPRFMDSFFLNLDVRIFGQFPGLFLNGTHGNAFLDEFFHFFYFSYYLIIPVTCILLYHKDVKLFESFLFQLSSLFYVCYLIYIFLPVEGPIPLRNEYYLQHGLFRSIVDFIWAKGEKPGSAFPSSHVAVAFLIAWWGSRHFKKLSVVYWLTFLFLSIATVYCMFHYAVDVIGGLLLGVLTVLTFSRVELHNSSRSVYPPG